MKLKNRYVIFCLLITLCGSSTLVRAQSNVYWRSSASSGYWVDGSENRWYRSSDEFEIRREDLVDGQFDSSASKTFTIVHFDNGNQTSMTVNAVGGAEHQIHQILFENGSDRSFAQADSAYLKLGGGGSVNAKIEAVTSSGTGTYTFNVPITLDKTTELNPVGGNLVINSAIANGGNGIEVYGSSSKSLSISGVISGAGGITAKNDTNILLSGTNTYTGTTSVTAGKLLVNGDNSSATGAVTVDSGATLGGYGTVGGATTISGTHNVSDSGSDRTQNFSGDLTYNAGSIFNWDLNSPTANLGVSSNEGSYDKVVAGGALGGTSRFDVILDSGDSFADAFWDTNKSWTDIFAKGSGSTLASIFTTFGGTDIATDGKVNQGGSLRGQFTFTNDTLNWTAVPEPTNFLVGLLLVAGLLRRKRGDASKVCLAR